jgi:hypothetical protein
MREREKRKRKKKKEKEKMRKRKETELSRGVAMILGAREALFRRRDFFLVWGVFLLFDLGFSRSMSGLFFFFWKGRFVDGDKAR